MIKIEKFDGCSYRELTHFVHSRISWIRELRRFLSDEASRDYRHLRGSSILKIAIYKFEIRRLLKMRRILKDSGYTKWSSEAFGKIS